MEEERAAKVLVVDDEAGNARALAMGLLLEGFEVETASDAEGALLAMAGAMFDFAIVDLMIPETNGIDLARMIRGRFPCVRVVLISAYHLSERQLVLADCGAIGFVPKPFDLRELASFLRSKFAMDPAGEVAAAKNDAAGPTL
jgi:DNA-binding response OmpR family regulator